MNNLRQQFNLTEKRRLRFPDSVRFPDVFEEFQGMRFFDPKIIPRIRNFVLEVSGKINEFCNKSDIVVYAQSDVVELDVQVEFGLWVQTAGAYIDIHAVPEDIEKIYNALPEILKDHRPTKKMERMIDEALEETIGEAPDNIWQILFHEGFEGAEPTPVSVCFPAPPSPQ